MPTIAQRRLAGLPVWAWAALLAGGIAVGLYLRHRNAAPVDAGGGSGSSATGVTGSGVAADDSQQAADLPSDLGYLDDNSYLGAAGGGAPNPPSVEARMDPRVLASIRAGNRLEAQQLKAERAELRELRHDRRPPAKRKRKQPR